MCMLFAFVLFARVNILYIFVLTLSAMQADVFAPEKVTVICVLVLQPVCACIYFYIILRTCMSMFLYSCLRACLCVCVCCIVLVQLLGGRDLCG